MVYCIHWNLLQNYNLRRCLFKFKVEITVQLLLPSSATKHDYKIMPTLHNYTYYSPKVGHLNDLMASIPQLVPMPDCCLFTPQLLLTKNKCDSLVLVLHWDLIITEGHLLSVSLPALMQNLTEPGKPQAGPWKEQQNGYAPLLTTSRKYMVSETFCVTWNSQLLCRGHQTITGCQKCLYVLIVTYQYQLYSTVGFKSCNIFF